MSEEKIEKLLELVADAGSGLEARGVQLRQGVAEIVGAKAPTAVKEENFNVLKYETQVGGKIGEFQVATKNGNLPEAWDRAYQILQKNNAVISTRYHAEGYIHSYWLHQDKIYRQKLKGKAPETKPEVDVTAATKAKFPSDLEKLLIFSQEGDYVIVRARQYLGSENFAKIASIVREQGGEYISAGKESHFRVPRK